MHTSKIVEIDGVFAGAAIRLPQGQGWRFVAAGPWARAADGCVAGSLPEAQAMVRRLVNRVPMPPTAGIRLPPACER